MRLPLVLLLLAAAQLASAQVAADSGLFAETGASVGYAGAGSGLLHTYRATVGYRLPSGLHFGVSAHESGGSSYATVSAGPEVGYTRPLSETTTLRLRADGRASFFTGGALAGQGVKRVAYTSFAEGTVTRRFRLGRGIDLAATGGLYGGAARTSGEFREAATFAEAGPVLGLQAEFNALGGRFAIGPYNGVPVLSTSGSVLGLGPMYESRGRSLVSFSF